MSVSKKELTVRIREHGMIPVFYHSDMDVLLRIVTIGYQCGLRIFEFTHQRDNKGLRFFEHLIGQRSHFPGLTFGVGTVLDATMTERYINAGAQFIASPFLRPDMGEVCKNKQILWMPGCSASDEVEKAHAMGAIAINILPGNVLGSDFIAPIARRYPELSLLPSGVSDLRDESLARWFESGAAAVKIGGQIFTRDSIVAKDWTNIAHHLVELLKAIKRARTTVKPIKIDS
ncbi:MAG: hypothetical protein ABI477_01380 [Chryseolinea sp.]